MSPSAVPLLDLLYWKLQEEAYTSEVAVPASVPLCMAGVALSS